MNIVRFFGVLLALLCISVTASAQGSRCQQDARISLAFSGDTVLNTCLVELDAPVRFQVQPFHQAHAYVVVDAAGVIQYIDFSNFIDFNSLPDGVFEVYAFSTVGNITATVGQDFATATLAEPCAGLTRNSVRVLNGQGAPVTLNSDATEYSICAGGNGGDTIFVSSPDPTAIFVITDDNGDILAINQTGAVTFGGATVGRCRIYATTATGLVVGDNIESASTGCGGGVSENFVTVTRELGQTGPITTETGETEVVLCADGFTQGVVRLDSSGTTLANFAYVLTDTNDMLIAGFPFDSINFAAYPDGDYRVYGVGYTGTFLPLPGSLVGEDELGSGCVALAENFISVTKQRPVGGAITSDLGMSATFCPEDLPATITLSTDAPRRFGYGYVLVSGDSAELILADDAVFSIADLPVGRYQVYGLAFAGAPPEVNSLAGLDRGCTALSENFVELIIEPARGGTISTFEGETAVTMCPGDGRPDVVGFTMVDNSAMPQVQLITDTSNVVVDFAIGPSYDFESSPVGRCRVWGLTFTGDLLVELGDTLVVADLSTGCSALTTNFITVTREVPEAGRVTFSDGSTEAVSCVSGFGVMDLSLTTTSRASNYVYLIVEADTIVSITNAPELSPAVLPTGSGSYDIYGLAYTGTLTAVVGSPIDGELATGCTDLSEPVLLDATRVDGGRITGNGRDSVFLCASNEVDGFVAFSTTSALADSNYFYVVTTATNQPVVLSILDSAGFDFGAITLDEVRVYAISYTGTNRVTVGFPVTFLPLSDDCFALSENFVTVFNGEPTITGLGSTDVPANGTLCTPDSATTIAVQPTGLGTGGLALIVIDTEDRVVLIGQDTANLAIGNLPAGNYRILAVAYAGELTVGLGEIITINTVFADNCFAVAPDTLALNYGGVLPPATIRYVGLASDTARFDLEDDAQPVVVVEDDLLRLGYRYLLTDTMGLIIRNPFSSGVIPLVNLAAGTYRIYGVEFTGTPAAQIGQAVTGALSNACFALSDNYLVVELTEPESGRTVSLSYVEKNPVELELYPNPVAADGQLRLSLVADQPLGAGRVSIVDVNGREVLSFLTLTGLLRNQQLDVSGLAAGTYFAVYTTSGTAAHARFIKH